MASHKIVKNQRKTQSLKGEVLEVVNQSINEYLIQALYSKDKTNGEGLDVFEGKRSAETEELARKDVKWWIKKQLDCDVALLRIINVQQA